MKGRLQYIFALAKIHAVDMLCMYTYLQ